MVLRLEQLLEAFEKAVARKLGPSNLLQVSSDGPNVLYSSPTVQGETKV